MEFSTGGEFSAELEQWFDDYARSLRRIGGRKGRPRSQATIDAYRKSFDRFWRFAHDNGIDRPEDVDHRLVNRWTDHLAEHDKVSPATVAILWRNARPFWSWWAKEMDTTNPFARADVPGIPETTVPVIDLDDIRKLLATCSTKEFDDIRDRAAIMVLIDCGVRLGELVNLDVDDWHRKNDVLYVNGKSGPRAVQHGPATGDTLARYMRARTRHSYATRTDRLWLGRRGPWGISGPQQMLVRRCRFAGLPRLHPHQFRHTWAHEAKASGLSDGDLAYLAGWETVAMVQRYGSSAASERARDSYRQKSLGDRL